MGAIRHHGWILLALLVTALVLSVPVWLPDKVVVLAGEDHPAEARIYADNTNGGASEARWIDRETLHWQCRVRAGATERLCGFQLAFPEGMDMSAFYGLRLKLEAQSKNKFMRVSVRNFAPEFSQAGDMLTAQFNQVLVPLEDFEQPVTLNFKEFAVAEWWLNKFQVPRQFSYPYFNRVLAIGIDIGNPPEVANHEFTLVKMELLRHPVSAEHWYFGVLTLWLSAIFAYGGWRFGFQYYRRRQDTLALATIIPANAAPGQRGCEEQP